MCAISGGVGLVARPLLVFLGFPPLAVIATSPLAGVVGDVPTLAILLKKRKTRIGHAMLLVAPVVIGSIVASAAAVSILKESLDMVLGIVLLLGAVSLLILREFGIKEHEVPFTGLRHMIAMVGTAFIAFLGTITGGLGVLYGALYMMVYGKSYIGASALWRLATYLGNIGAIAVFLLSGAVDWLLWLAITPGMVIGSYFGTHFGLNKGEGWVRWLVILIAFVSGVKLLFF